MKLATFERREKYLLVVGHGSRDNIAEMEKASALILAEAKESNSRYLLVDYRNLNIHTKLGEAFNIVRHYEESHPELKEITVAGVFDQSNAEFGKLWTEISRKRGFFIEFFLDITQAEQWLLKQIEQ